MPIFCCLGRSKESVEVRPCVTSPSMPFFCVLWCFYLPPNPQAGGLPLVDGSRMLIQKIRSYSEGLPHPLPEDSPCRGDKEQNMVHKHRNIETDLKQIRCEGLA
jgi:hypothetical protein